MLRTDIRKLRQRVVCSALALILAFSQNPGYAQSLFVSTLPEPGTMLAQSPSFVPVLVKGLVIHPDKPLNFEFIVDSGNDSVDQAVIKEESDRIAKYFLAAVTVPEDQLWVNLSPFEKDHIIENDLGMTVLGRDMLAQDYVLKQLTASLIYPEKGLGKEFWARIYKEAQAKFGTTDIPVDTFNKVWIMPDKAEVYEKGNAVYVTEARLKVMLDSDLLATPLQDDKAAMAKSILREVILPAIEKEVNEGKNFAAIRQVYHAAILAKWYRELISNSLLADAYMGKNRVAGVTSDEKRLKEEIYQRYIAAYKKGVFNLIREEPDAATGTSIPRKYFSGGESLRIGKLDRAESSSKIGPALGKMFRVDMAMSPAPDASMVTFLGDLISPEARLYASGQVERNLKNNVKATDYQFSRTASWLLGQLYGQPADFEVPYVDDGETKYLLKGDYLLPGASEIDLGAVSGERKEMFVSAVKAHVRWLSSAAPTSEASSRIANALGGYFALKLGSDYLTERIAELIHFDRDFSIRLENAREGVLDKPDWEEHRRPAEGDIYITFQPLGRRVTSDEHKAESKKKAVFLREALELGVPPEILKTFRSGGVDARIQALLYVLEHSKRKMAVELGPVLASSDKRLESLAEIGLKSLTEGQPQVLENFLRARFNNSLFERMSNFSRYVYLSTRYLGVSRTEELLREFIAQYKESIAKKENASYEHADHLYQIEEWRASDQEAIGRYEQVIRALESEIQGVRSGRYAAQDLDPRAVELARAKGILIASNPLDRDAAQELTDEPQLLETELIKAMRDIDGVVGGLSSYPKLLLSVIHGRATRAVAADRLAELSGDVLVLSKNASGVLDKDTRSASSLDPSNVDIYATRSPVIRTVVVVRDAAQADPSQNGGIDIQNIGVSRKAGSGNVSFNNDALRAVLRNGFNGFTPVMISITPVADLLTLFN